MSFPPFTEIKYSTSYFPVSGKSICSFNRNLQLWPDGRSFNGCKVIRHTNLINYYFISNKKRITCNHYDRLRKITRLWRTTISLARVDRADDRSVMPWNLFQWCNITNFGICERFTNLSLSKSSIIAAAIAIFASGTGFATSNPWEICDIGKRVTCIVDGDTFWKGGIKYRLFGVDTPEAGGRAKCKHELRLAAKATYRLQSILKSGQMFIIEHGRDRYGRVLAEVVMNGANVSALLINEGVGKPYNGARPDPKYWCN